ncbi:alpha/beta hydrolase [Saccharothrix syringae]|uniref:Alpha/beta hydrolase n=1 Tax=Saccharothrix syringae TaxID=103733 RepID=A0A5Q0GZP0_SACSY|nr:alpha/beta hydrolase [Saccharothrix syringae]QFZ19030.1 alpha/beta hydrolase [Saccharothrix syringae]
MGSEQVGWGAQPPEPPPVLDPAVARLVRASAAPPHLQELGPEDGRLALLESQGYSVDDDRAPARFSVAPVGPSGLVGFHDVRPAGAAGSLPAVLYVHGGRWMLGDARTHSRLVRDLALASGAAFLVPEYTRVPEARYPVAVEECYALLTWAVEHAADLGVDGTRIAVAGDCAGATMATALTMLAKRRGGPRLRAQLLYYPLTDARCDTPSHRRFAEGYLLTSGQARWCWEQYASRPADLDEPTAVPMRASRADLAGLPATLVVSAEADVVRDEGERYAERLREAGVRATATRYAGTTHDFASLRPLEAIPATRAAVAEGGAFLRAELA